MLYLDFETRSECDLPTHGVYNYAQDASTEVLCLSYAFDNDEVQTWTPDAPFPEAIRSYTGEIRAHNAAFERLIFWYVLHINFKLEQFYCTAAQARANCLPGSLEDVGRALSSKMKKDHRGKQLIRLMCVPPFNNSPTLMQEMIAYCEQDVRAMRVVSQTMRQLSVTELLDYHVNERINDRGVLVDTALCLAAVQYASVETDEIQALVADITKGEVTSVRSPKMRLWVQARVGEEALKLMYNGERYSIDKTVRANLLTLDADQVPHDVADVIQCADDIWASSVAKFNRLADLADTEDKRVRGAFVFNGGAATGRASSYGAQVHNFTRKCVKDPQATRDAMVRGHSVVPKFGVRVTDVLKGMLRPSLIPALGNVLIVADWAAVEARCNPWLSGDAEEVLQVFRDGADIYVREAQRMFGVIQVSPEQRQVGKVAILACFTAKTKVLTDNGVKDIVEVLLTDKLWDGISWVNHQGLISRGEREVINVCGMEVTPDHLIKINQTWIQAQELASNKSTLRLALVTGSASLPFLGLKGLNTEPVLSTWLEFNARVAQRRILLWTTIYVKENLLAVILALKSSLVIIVRIISNTLMPAQMMHTVDVCLTGYPPAKIDAITRKTAGMPIMAGGAYTYTSLGELIKPLFFDISCHLTDGINRIWSLIEQTLTKATSRITYASSLEKKISLIKDQSKICSKKSSSLKPVYDILNSGENHQFTVITDAGALLVHNCGYGGGVGAFAAMSKAYGVSLTESEAKRTVDAWRRGNQWAVTYWQQLEIAYTKAMRHKGHEFSAGRVTYMFDGIHLWYILPSGRVLCYPFAKLETDGITYLKAAWKPTADAKEWPRARLWKGLACENITQAVANDLLRHSLRQIDAILHIHDEIVVECAEKNAVAVAAQLEHIMCTPPAWASGLPLSVEVQIMKRYGK